jgi:hypothetical protein
VEMETTTRRLDGKFEEQLGGRWVAEYFEDPKTGSGRVEVFLHDVPPWVEEGVASLNEAREAASNYVDQTWASCCLTVISFEPLNGVATVLRRSLAQ